MTNIFKNKYLILLLGALFLVVLPALAADSSSIPQVNSFNPNYIISDAEMLDSSAMNLADIQKFLEDKNSFLATYKATSSSGEIKSAAEIIYDAAVNNNNIEEIYDPITGQEINRLPVRINPKVILVTLEKEQSLISRVPSQHTLDRALGYGCPDSANGGCNARWTGFAKQVNATAWQFFSYVTNTHLYNIKLNQTYTLTNTNKPDMQVTPANRATAALYNFTPHVYNGNYNFYNIWQRYFSFNTFFPNGSLLQAEGEPGVWLLQNGTKRPFTSRGALMSRYDINKIIKVTKSDLDRYPRGAPIKFSQYAIVRAPNGDMYLIVDDQKRLFASTAVFKKIGINPDEVVSASWDDVNVYKNGTAITATSTYPTGALVQNNKTGGVYWVINGTKAAILDKIFLTTKFKNKKIVRLTPKELDAYSTISPVVFDDGELLKSPVSSAVYVVADGKKNAITSGKIFESLGYKWVNVITVSPQVLYQYALGTVIDEIVAQRQVAVSSPTKAVNAAANPVKTSSAPAVNSPASTTSQVQ